MNELMPVINKADAMLAVIVTLLSYILGKHWYLFVFFLALNIGDYITGCIKSRINAKTNSSKGAVGVLKKLGYWIMIAVAFGMGAFFIEIGEIIGVNLEISSLIGWFVLANLLINEIRSIIENLVESGYSVPKILTKGLEVANDVLDKSLDVDEEKELVQHDLIEDSHKKGESK